jgi:osmoprotectant transport system permease protein
VGPGSLVNGFSGALVYLNDPYNWTRDDGFGIFSLLRDHLQISVVAILLAGVVAVPIGIALGHSGRGSGFVVALSNVSRAVPTLALLTIFAVTPIGFGNRATTIALAVFAFPLILANTFVGLRGVDADLREAARGMGMSSGQVIRRVEVPLAFPLIMTGIRSATVQVVATAGLAALVGGGGLGRLINLGFAQQNYAEVVAGAILVAGLAILTEVTLVVVSRALTPGQKRLPFTVRARKAPATPEPERLVAAEPL